ncbi:translocation/assembly module TamB domain-containing protein [Rhodocyclaceae bacterium SMB388]
MAGMLYKLFRIGLWLAGLLILVVAITLGAVIATESGLRAALGRASTFAPGVTIAAVEGTLWRGFSLSGVEYDDDAGTRVTVDRVRVEVTWPALASMQLHVREIAVHRTRISLPGTETPPEDSGPLDLDALIPQLPFSVRVDRLLIEDFALQPSPDAGWLELTTLSARASADATRFELADFSLSLAAPVIATLELAATMDAARPHALTASAKGSLEVDQGRVAWALDTTGPLDALRTLGRVDWQGQDFPDAGVDLNVEHGFDAARLVAIDTQVLEGVLELAGTVEWSNGVAWDLALSGRDLQPVKLVEQADGPVSFDLTSQGRFGTGGVLTHETVLSDASASFAGISVSALTLDVTGGLDNAEIRALSMDVLEGKITAQGSAEWGPDISWSVSAEALNIDPGVLAEGAGGSVSFALESEGTLDEAGVLSHLSRLLNLRGEVAAIPFDGIGLKVEGDLEHIRVDEFAGRILDAALAGGAEIRLGDTLAWDARLGLDDADLSRLADHVQPAISGTIGFDLESRGELRDGQPFLTASLDRLRGNIEGEALSGSIRAEVAGDTVRLEPADLSLGRNRIQVIGTVTPPFDLRYDIALPSLSELPLPEALALTGRIEGSGTVRGTLAAPEIDARLSGRGIGSTDFRLDHIDIQAQAQTDNVNIRARLSRMEAAGQQIDTLALNASGRLDAHEAELDATTDFGRLQLGLRGGVVDEAWSGQLRRLDLGDTPVGNWSLEAPAALSASATDFALAQACLTEQGRTTDAGRICAAASRSGSAPIRTALNARLPLALAEEFLPPALAVPGILALEASAEVGEQIRADALLRLPDNHMIASGLTDEPLRIDYRDTRVQITVRDDRLDAQLSAQLPDHLSLNGDIRARLDDTQSLGGTLSLNMPDLSWLGAITPEVVNMSGTVNADIALGGTLTAPAPTGTLRIDGLALMLPATGVAYRQGEVDVTIDAAQQLVLRGQLRGGEGGEVRLRGEGSLAELPDWRAELTLEGEDLAVLRTPELSVDISPEISISADHSLATVRGRVLVPVFEAEIRTLPEGSVSESPDLALASAIDEGALAYRVRTDIEIILGDRVRLDGMGFSTRLAGQLRLRGDETAPIAAFGEVDLRDGRYAAFGQDLRIEQGRLTFNGPLDDPGLDVRASRTVGEYQAGLEIRGTLGNPVTQVFSVPSLAESDALSLLLTGRLLSGGTSGADASMLINALTGLGVSQGDEIVRDIGQTIGFDEVGLDGSEFTVGKRVGSRLLVRYAVGVFDGVDRLITEYKINRFFDLEITSSAAAQGGDVIFRVER